MDALIQPTKWIPLLSIAQNAQQHLMSLSYKSSPIYRQKIQYLHKKTEARSGIYKSPTGLHLVMDLCVSNLICCHQDLPTSLSHLGISSCSCNEWMATGSSFQSFR